MIEVIPAFVGFCAENQSVLLNHEHTDIDGAAYLKLELWLYFQIKENYTTLFGKILYYNNL